MSARHDVLDTLLPDASVAERADARRLVMYLRLLRDAARGQGAARAELDVRRAADECRRAERAEDLRALGTVFDAYVRAALPPDSFAAASAVATRQTLDEAWLRIATVRARETTRSARLPRFPDPDESAVDVAARALGSARATGLFAGRVEVWEARLARARDGLTAGERRFERIRSRAHRAGHVALEAAGVQGLCEQHLDRFDPEGAAELLARNPLLPATFPRLAWLAAWCRLLVGGDADEALGFVRGLEPAWAHLPPSLAELRERRPEWAALLPGATAPVRAHTLVEDDASFASPRRLRAAWGASVVAVFAIERAGSVRCVEWDAAHSIAPRARTERDARSAAWSRVGEPESAMCSGGDERIEHGSATAFAPPMSRTVARIPLRAGESEGAIGWLHIESAHHLLPCAARRARAARYWADRLGARASDAADERARVRAVPVRNESNERNAFVERLLARLPMRLTRRRAVVVSLPFEADVDRMREPRRGARGVLPTRFVAGSSGGGFATLEPRLGGGVRRALRSAGDGVVRFSRHSSLAVFPPAGSGVAVPFVLLGRAHGLLVVESTRCGDFVPGDADRLRAFVAREAAGLRAAQFRQWHEEQWGARVVFDPAALARGESFLADLERARASGALRIVGPSGAGKRTLQRWVSFERGGDARASIHVGGDALERAGARDAALAVAPLADRRDEIPALAEVLAERSAHALDCAPVCWDDDVRALLFRQPWPGNVRELGAWVTALTRRDPGATVGAEDVRAFDPRIAWVERLESRPARTLDVHAALAVTASAGGAWNKRRAARYLGWDRGTLSAVLAREFPAEGRP